jgi:serine/threonine-protein kinase
MNEARAAARIQGEHVARVLDIGQLPTGAPYMVLEYLEGADLAQIRHRRGALSVPEVADYTLQALDALAQAHAAGIVHRDLKPANLFLAKRHDGTNVVKVLDFGISKNLTPFGSSPQGMTNTRAILGSPEYMSPSRSANFSCRSWSATRRRCASIAPIFQRRSTPRSRAA